MFLQIPVSAARQGKGREASVCKGLIAYDDMWSRVLEQAAFCLHSKSCGLDLTGNLEVAQTNLEVVGILLPGPPKS